MIKTILGACRRHPAVAAMLIAAAMLLPMAALVPFNTKGEPREAIVALSMLLSGDWVLPVSFGADIPYKPPFLAWMIAVFSLPLGHVTEFTARLPSVLAAMALAGTVVSFARRDMGWSAARSLCAALLTLTCVEVWRNAGVCRVDMVLTAAITGAVVLLARLALHGGFRRFAGATILMTFAVLTKGPVGMVLPCLIIAVWAFASRLAPKRILALAGIVALAAVLSLVIPAWWYYEAYRQGGEEFYRLAMEENVGRMTGTMSYASHENPWYYNLITLIAGLAPYTLLLLLRAVRLRREQLRRHTIGSAAMLCIVASVVTLVFYTIPASKRSVYLLPMYPFLAIGIIVCWEWLTEHAAGLERLFSGLIRGIGAAVCVALAGAPFVIRDAEFNVWVCLVSAVAIGWLAVRRGGLRRLKVIPYTLALVTAILTITGIAILPPVMEAKTDRPLAEAIEANAAPGEPVWEYITQDPLLRYYTAGFYTGDRIRLLPEGPVKAGDGWLVTSPDDAAALTAANPGLSLTKVWETRRSCDTRRPAALYRLTTQ